MRSNSLSALETLEAERHIMGGQNSYIFSMILIPFGTL
ncbi:hypothetical protein D9613_011601 [Agrocybe pediades]|uniref:Uncharacterized protein n=1 Tax=Agrocybe pediades TaxID=84607 RepID=A0A8H4QWW2_9AGAR|nr:hypothetical protein D9613_011601 [Agrocybe pediades]